MAAKDYYAILGVERGASKEEIKRAFYRLAHKYHPDKKGGDEAKFKEVNEAYQILSDESRRQQYDNVGAGGFDPNGFDFSNFARGAGGGFEFDLGDIFSEFFRGGQGKEGGRRQVRRGRDISVDIEISFADAIFGTERKILITKTGLCPSCQGSGGAPGAKLKTCATCNGKGQLRETRDSFLGSFTTVRDCQVCGGAGQVPETPCSTCRGAGVTTRPEEIKAVIPPGIDNGEMIRLSNQGEAVARGLAGDLYLRVRVEKHPTLRRDGLNLVRDLSVKLSDALLGAEEEIETLDGKLKVKIPAGITHGEMLRVRGRGVPSRPGKRGDLLLTIKIKLPAKLSRRARGLVEDLRQEGL
jgi:molecular chaperone DnaJ